MSSKHSKHSSTRVPAPRTPFEIFYEHMQRRPSIPESQKTSSYAAHRWSQMTDTDRQPWVDLAIKEKRHRESVARAGMGIPSQGRGGGDKAYDPSEPRVRSSSDPSDPQPIPYNGYAPKDELDLRHARPDVVPNSNQMTYGWSVDPRESEGYARYGADNFANWDFNQAPAPGYQTTAYNYSDAMYMPFPGTENTSSSSNPGASSRHSSRRHGH